MTDDVAYGELADSDDIWAALAAEFTPAKSLTRVAEKARFTVATVAVVGTALTGLGLVSADRLDDFVWSQRLALAAVALAVAAVVAALTYLTLRVQWLNPYNLLAVEPYVTRELRRSRSVVVASWFLVAAVVAAGASALLAYADDPGPQTAVTLAKVGTGGEERTVQGMVAVSGLDGEEPITVRVTTTGAGTDELFRSVSTPTAEGTVEVKIPEQSVPAGAFVQLTVLHGDMVLETVSSR